jgi:upstream activation factor subunit UAF30
MAKGKSSTKTKPEVSTSNEVVAIKSPDTLVVADTKADTKAKTKTKPKVKSTKPVQETPVKDNVVLTKPAVVDLTADIESTGDLSDQMLTTSFVGFFQKIQSVATQINVLKLEFRRLEKKAVRELKLAQKINAKRKRKSGNRSPSGFVKPALISDELASFLDKPVGTEMARTEVTREINTYIRAHNLQDKTNGRKINPDKSLADLLKIKSEDELTYFNLQRYMSPHFAKSEKALQLIPAVK